MKKTNVEIGLYCEARACEVLRFLASDECMRLPGFVSEALHAYALKQAEFAEFFLAIAESNGEDFGL